MDKRFIAILAVILVLFGGIFWFTQKKEDTKNGTKNNTSQSAGSNHTFGQNTKGVTLVEYGDLQCPACGQYYPIVKQVKEKYAADIRFQFRHFPLTQIHQNAMIASRSAEAAGKQNKFWEMHDVMYEQQQTWSSAPNAATIFEEYAKQLGLNVATFKKDVTSSSTFETINADIKKAQGIGAASTPTFELDGKKIEEPPRDLAGFSKLIDEAIAKKAKQ